MLLICKNRKKSLHHPQAAKNTTFMVLSLRYYDDT